MPSCSIVIRAFNEARHIERLLHGISQQTLRECEVIVVDSGSTDDTLAVVRRYPARVVTIRPEDFTFGRSLNAGIAGASGEMIVIASAHVYPVYPDWLEQLTRPLREPDVALVYGRQRGGPTTRFSERQVFAQWFPERSITRQSTPFCNNANAVIRRELWRRRAYSEDLPGLEDLEWATWAQSQGFHIAYQAEAEVVHIHEESLGAVFNRYRREGMALKAIRPHETFHLGDFLRLVGSNVASDLWHARREKALARQWPGILGFRLMQFWGTYRGFRQTGPLTSQLKRTFYYPRGFRSGSGSKTRGLEPIDYETQPPASARSQGQSNAKGRGKTLEDPCAQNRPAP